MGWSVGHRPPPESALIDEILLAAGKALYWANQFESKCKDVLQFAYFIEILEADPVISLEEVAARIPSPKMLNRTLQDLSSNTTIGLNQEQSAILAKAREARNYIAHEGAGAIGVLWSYNVQGMLDTLRSLRVAVINLANGDNLVSEWVYRIEERKAPLPQTADYPDRVDGWVFGHLPREWLGTDFKPGHTRPRTIRAMLTYKPWYSRPDWCSPDA
jgi:hypothetical protein